MENNQGLQLDFSTLMAASVHDMKNILGAVLESLDWLSSNIEPLDEKQSTEFQKSSQLLAHVNSELMQLLCIYKFEKKQYSLLLQDVEVEDFLSLQRAFLIPLVKGGLLSIDIDCDEELIWDFDEMLLSSAVRNAAMNALKFAKSKVLLTASKEENYLKITINDDGEGFPKKMLGVVENQVSTVDFSSGSTGLGLYFAEQVSKLHDKKDKPGRVVLDNGGQLGGACFHIFIP